MSAAQRVIDAVHGAVDQLSAAGFETPRLDAEVLIRHVAGWDRTAYFLHRQEPLLPHIESAFRGLVARRQRGEPVAYLTGTREFMGLPFLVTPDVLVPRPETELLVEWALGRLERGKTRSVLDVGTGSGAIILSLAAAIDPSRGVRLIGADVSTAALSVACRNQKNLSKRGTIPAVIWVCGSLADWCGCDVDLLLANLPYLRPDQLAENPQLAAEPELALVAGEDGLALIRELIADLPRLLASNGAVGLEIDPSQAEEVQTLLASTLPDAEVTVRQDLSGRARHVIAERVR